MKKIRISLDAHEIASQDIKSVKQAAREATLGMDLRTRKVPRKRKEKGGSKNLLHLQDE